MTLTPRLGTKLVLCLVAIAALTAADLSSKKWAFDKLSVERPSAANQPACEPGPHGGISPQRRQRAPIVLVNGYLEFRYAENCGAAFGFMRGQSATLRKAVFYGAAAGAIIMLMWMFVTGRGGRLFALSVPLIIAGAIGNLVDRVTLGYVVDFIRVHLDDRWSYPTFNVADAWISIGVGLIILDSFAQARREKRQKALG